VSTIGKAIVYESSCTLREDEGLMMVSDGITQAGLGCGLVNGWEIQGVASFITKHIMGNEIKASDFVEIIHAHARRLWRKAKGDDCSVVMAYVRRGITVNMISGPPSDDRLDKQWLDGFINSPGIKVVCGGTTSKVVARELKKTITLATEPVNLLSPPKYEISGITLVTEGIVTLNQVFNILGEDTSEFIDESPVYELNNLLNNADKVIFYIGHAYNPGIGNIQFRQQGILSRKAIIPLIIDKLRKSGKLVIVHEWE
jgi:hypothetical protein